MKAENMKLLDLQTGKYFELGKDWFCGGDRIYLVGRLKECITSFNKFLREQIETVIKYNTIVGQRNIGYEIACKVATSGDECVNNAVASQVDSGYVEKSEPQGILKTLCDKTGAVIYGDRYVLLNGEQDTSIHDDNHFYTVGDVVVNEYNCYGCVTIGLCSTEYSYHNNVVDIPELRGNCESGVLYCKFEILGNFFEEHSKQLRKEKNKFEELIEKLK